MSEADLAEVEQFCEDAMELLERENERAGEGGEDYTRWRTVETQRARAQASVKIIHALIGMKRAEARKC